MPEMTIMEFFKWVCALSLIAIIMSVALFSFEVKETTNFKQQVNYQIERHGGLTKTAMLNLTQYSEEQYNGRYKVESSRLNEKVAFGEVVEYTVIGNFSIKFVPVIPDVEREFVGNAQSLVR